MTNSIPKHLAFIMDGNGRWATMRGLNRLSGHKKGLDVVENVIDYCMDVGVEILSLYVFSTENWKRPKSEVDGLFDLANNYLSRFEKFCTKGIRVLVSGERTGLPPKLSDAVEEIQLKTITNGKLIVNLCINYGGRAELVHAVNKIINSGVKEISEQTLSENLYHNLPDADFIVRTGGQMRMSNFLLYQSAYSELLFIDTLWPDFDRRAFDAVLEIYAKRVRNFGGIKI